VDSSNYFPLSEVVDSLDYFPLQLSWETMKRPSIHSAISQSSVLSRIRQRIWRWNFWKSSKSAGM